MNLVEQMITETYAREALNVIESSPMAYLTKRAGDPRFHQLLKQIGDLHDKKQADYGRPTDPFSNVRASEDFGVPGWVGCMMRANDKMRRIQTAAQGNDLLNESLKDSLMDLAVYSLIAIVLLEEERG